MHLSFALTSGGLPPAPSAQLELSPDGKWVVYPALVDGKLRLFLRGFAQASGRFIEGTDDARSPFFSPDSQWIAFVSGNVMKKIPVSGGSPMSICTMSSAAGAFTNEFVGGAWASNDTIFFVPQFNGGIWTVSAAGGGPKLLLATDEGKDRIAYLYLRVLPGGRGLVFTLVPNRAKTADELDIAVLETGASEPRTVIRGGVNAKYMSTGHLVYARNAALLAVAFDLRRLDVAGTPVPILEGVQRSSLGDAVFSLSEAGTLMYEAAGAARFDTALVEVSRKGAARSIASGQGRIQEFSISPDGGAIAARVAAENDDVWTFDAARGSPLRLTFEPGDEIWPQWMPGGSRIAFGTRTGRIFLKRSDGTGQREEIARGEFQRMPSSFSPDGKTLAFVEIHPTRKNDILMLSLDGTRKVEPFLATDADELAPKFSPDGRWLAYVSDEAGRKDVYIVPIGSSGGRKRVSSDGGTSPVWSRSGRELFFLKGDKLLSVTVDARGSPVGGERVVLDAPKLNDLQFQVEAPFYDVLPDGDRFVMLMTPKYVPPTHFNVVVNWLEEIRQRVPVGR
jgi:serine/threonine-protein kinase